MKPRGEPEGGYSHQGLWRARQNLKEPLVSVSEGKCRRMTCVAGPLDGPLPSQAQSQLLQRSERRFTLQYTENLTGVPTWGLGHALVST